MIYSLESLVTHSFPLVFLFLLNLLLQQDRNQVFFTYCKHWSYSVVVELNSSHMVWLYQKWIFIHGMCMPKLMASRSSKIGYLLCISDYLVNRWQMCHFDKLMNWKRLDHHYANDEMTFQMKNNIQDFQIESNEFRTNPASEKFNSTL